MGGQGKIRAFIALKTPAEWTGIIENIQRELRAKVPSKAIRWVNPNNMHLTLRFLGYVVENEVDQVRAILNGVSKHTAFLLRPGRLGAFPRVLNPRVLWLGLEGMLEPLKQLQKEIQAATAGIGQPPEDREFKAHLTIARVQNLDQSDAKNLAHQFEKFEIEDAPEWRVEEVEFMRSHLSPQGARYERICHARLGDCPE